MFARVLMLSVFLLGMGETAHAAQTNATGVCGEFLKAANTGCKGKAPSAAVLQKKKACEAYIAQSVQAAQEAHGAANASGMASVANGANTIANTTGTLDAPAGVQTSNAGTSDAAQSAGSSLACGANATDAKNALQQYRIAQEICHGKAGDAGEAQEEMAQLSAACNMDAVDYGNLAKDFQQSAHSLSGMQKAAIGAGVLGAAGLGAGLGALAGKKGGGGGKGKDDKDSSPASPTSASSTPTCKENEMLNDLKQCVASLPPGTNSPNAESTVTAGEQVNGSIGLSSPLSPVDNSLGAKDTALGAQGRGTQAANLGSSSGGGGGVLSSGASGGGSAGASGRGLAGDARGGYSSEAGYDIGNLSEHASGPTSRNYVGSGAKSKQRSLASGLDCVGKDRARKECGGGASDMATKSGRARGQAILQQRDRMLNK